MSQSKYKAEIMNAAEDVYVLIEPSFDRLSCTTRLQHYENIFKKKISILKETIGLFLLGM